MIGFVGIDLSLRSTGLVCIDEKGDLADYNLVHSTPEQLNDEELLISNITKIITFVEKQYVKFDELRVAIEGLSFAGRSGEKDKIDGHFWFLKVSLKIFFPDVLVGIIPVNSWRSRVLTRQDSDKYKKRYGKLGVKIGCTHKLPDYVRNNFQDYIRKYKLDQEKKKGKWKNKPKDKNPLFDLTDAFFIAEYRRKLIEN
jgi:hypothetical protein